uniref:Ribosomal protein S10 n=1 Tax=Pleurocladia lacustris TaxID=246121 RepID=A0A1I9LWA7_9PHAE|nr:ribosomal protein S10 [Pleurocladia lacustris]
MENFKKNLYICEIWVSSNNKNSLKLWSSLLPLSGDHTGLCTEIKRFTLLRSPLGNKTSKDQFERRECRSYFVLESKDPFKLLSLLSILKYSANVKLKIIFKTRVPQFNKL